MEFNTYQAIDLLNKAEFKLENIELLITSAGTFINELNFNQAIVYALCDIKDVRKQIDKATEGINQ